MKTYPVFLFLMLNFLFKNNSTCNNIKNTDRTNGADTLYSNETDTLYSNKESQYKIDSLSTLKTKNIPADNIRKIFESAEDGAIIHIKPGTYIIDSLINIKNKSLTIYAAGAIFKMAEGAGYNGIRFVQDADNGKYKGKIEWHGGTFDGNRFFQNSPVANKDKQNKLKNAKLVWAGLGNTGILTVQRYASVIFKDITIQDNAGEGIVAFNCKAVLYKSCTGKNGLPISQNNRYNPLNTGASGQQWTYFKVRSGYDCHAIWDSVNTDGGSIGIHFSSDHAGKNSIAEINNCVIKNPMQDAVHIEHCETLIINNLTATGDLLSDDSVYYRPKIHVGNETKNAFIKKLYLKNGEIDFNQGKSLQHCNIEDFTIVSEIPILKNMITNAITVKNGSVEGKFGEAVYSTDNIINVKITGKGNHQGNGFTGAKYVEGCTFTNLAQAGTLTGLGSLYKCEITNCDNGITAQNGKYIEITGNTFKSIGNNAITVGKNPGILEIADNNFDDIASKEKTDKYAVKYSKKQGSDAGASIILSNNKIKSGKNATTKIINESGVAGASSKANNASSNKKSSGTGASANFAAAPVSVSYNPGVVKSDSLITQTFSMKGVNPGQAAQVSFAGNLKGCAISAYISNPNEATVIIRNFTGKDVTLESGKLQISANSQ